MKHRGKFTQKDRQARSQLAELRLPKKIDSFIGKDKPSIDTIGEVFTKIIPDDLRRLHWNNCYQLKRNKALDTNLPLNAVGIDGHEFFSH